MPQIDIYSDAAASFEADVNLLIRNTLHAALTYLSGTADAELRDIKSALDRAVDDEAQEHLVDAHVDVLATGLSQERFLRSMALVALASCLLHALKKMARLAEHFSQVRTTTEARASSCACGRNTGSVSRSTSRRMHPR